MKRFIVGLGLVLGLSGMVYADDFKYSPQVIQNRSFDESGKSLSVSDTGESTAIYFPCTTTCFTLYGVSKTTGTTVTYTVWADSISLVTTAGVPFGTTTYVFADTNKDTVSELITYLNAISSTTIGATFVAALPNGSYGANATSTLTEVEDVDISELANIKNVAGATLGYTYTIPAVSGKSIFLSNLLCNATFGSGTTTVSIYDGATTTTQLRKEKVTTTAVDYPSQFDVINGSVGTAMRIDVVGTAALTLGYIDFTYRTK